MADLESKRCSECGESHPARDFKSDSNKCRICRAAYFAKRYRENLQSVREYRARPEVRGRKNEQDRARYRAAHPKGSPEGGNWLWKRIYRSPAYLWEKWVLPRVEKEPNSGCWLWMGFVSGSGYALIKANKKDILISRMACVIFHGADLSDKSWLACHHCDVKLCINPDHIYVGNHSTNIRDSFRRGRKDRPRITACKNGHELTPDNVSDRPLRPDRKTAQRVCKRCHIETQRRYLARKRGA